MPARKTGKPGATGKTSKAPAKTARNAPKKAGQRSMPAKAASSAGVRRSWLLTIDYGLCRGCGGCAEGFPQFFEMRDEKAWIINAERFDGIRDKGVMTVCPYYAISIEEA